MKVDTTRPDRTYSQIWDFELNQKEVEAIQLNIIKILQDACGQVFGVYKLAHPKYQKSSPIA